MEPSVCNSMPDRRHDVCECCQRDAVNLWIDHEAPGEYLMCESCIIREWRKRMAAKAKQRFGEYKHKSRFA